MRSFKPEDRYYFIAFEVIQGQAKHESAAGWVDHNAFGPINKWLVCSLILGKIFLVQLVPSDVRF